MGVDDKTIREVVLYAKRNPCSLNQCIIIVAKKLQ